MCNKGIDFKHKEVINIRNAKRLGCVKDICADVCTGTITAIIVPGNNKFINIFSKCDDITIPWNRVKCIGEDIILVDIHC